MASSWTRLHQELGIPHGPLTYAHIEQAADEIDGERDDLDWKRDLPKKADPGEWNEFSKDVTAMANARGGLLIYGVRNDRKITGVDLNAVHTEHLFKWLRANTQPYVAGVDAYTLSSEDGRLSVLVVDVPASAMAPHFILGSTQREKEIRAFAVPFRYSDHTGWLAEHEIDRAYRDRFARHAAADQALERHLDRVREVVLTDGLPPVAWLIAVSRPSRPLPPLVPTTGRDQAREVLSSTLATAADLQGEFGVMQLMRDTISGAPQVGLRSWIEGNFFHPFKGARPRGRLMLVELHHDGTVVYAVDVSRRARQKDIISTVPPQDAYTPVETRAVQVGACEVVALSHEFRRARRIESSTDLAAVLVSVEKSPAPGLLFPGYAPVVENHGFLDVPATARCPKKILPVGSELPPAADRTALRGCAQSLASGLLNQFGLESIFP
ncbi:AlbA family DNA-binding domain-containing protein [Streptomyces sp. CA-256286]|uniref:AlbA family DNA-binding domain-containing protein n=1 Tax=Streptomyces sp. CA-256286 TaxID=2801033 RepID=UPI001A989FF1|nr:ATP-binding protein [Streptomyces sp. CA-256286]